MADMSRDLVESGLGWRYTRHRMAALIEEPDTVALVACGDSALQGYAVMHFGDLQAHLVLLCVQPSLRQRGIGRRLHTWLQGSAEVAGIAQITLELRADNVAALSFYRGLGYVETHCVPGYYDGRITARRMALRLHGAMSR